MSAWARHSTVARQGYWLSQFGRLDEADQVLGKAFKKQYDAAVAAELGFVKFRRTREHGRRCVTPAAGVSVARLDEAAPPSEGGA